MLYTGKENQAREGVNQSVTITMFVITQNNWRHHFLFATQETIERWAKARTEKFTGSKHFESHSSTLILNMGQEHLACC